MKSLSQRILMGLLLCCASLILLMEFFELPSAKQRMETLPILGEGFIGQAIGMTQEEEEIFKGAHVMKRFYRVGGQRCFVTVLDGTHNRHIVHDPFYCFIGSGWKLEERIPISVPGGSGQVLRMSKEEQTTEAIYWFSDGQKRYTSMFLYLWQTSLRRLTLGHSGEEPVRVMIAPVDDTPMDWEKMVEEFPEVFSI